MPASHLFASRQQEMIEVKSVGAGVGRVSTQKAPNRPLTPKLHGDTFRLRLS